MTKVAEAVTAFIDATKGVKHIDRTALHQLISDAGKELSEAEIESLIRILQPVIRGYDWTRYLIREGLPLNGLTECEREDLEAQQTGGGVGGDDDDPLTQEFRQREAGHKRWQAAESPLVERLESLVGADATTVEQIAEAVGSTTEAFMTLPKQPGEQLPTRLRLALPDAVPTDCDKTGKLLHDVLRAIGVRGRALSDVILLCGRELGVLFPDEVDPVAGTYAFRQVRLLVERHLTVSPKDVEAVAWLAELSLRASDRESGMALAQTLWTLTARYDPSDLARLVQFSLCHEWDYGEPRFDGRSWDAGLVGHLEAEWYDRREPLALALLRRAFITDYWNADLVQTVAELRFGSSLGYMPNDIMPAAGWVWTAHSEGSAGYYYYKKWEEAFAAATERAEGDIAILSVPHLIAGAIRGRCNPAYEEWLGALQRNAVTVGERRTAAHVVEGVKNVAGHLSPPARVALERLAREFAAEMNSSAEEATAEADALVAGLADVAEQEKQASTYLGSSLWERLSAQTRCHVQQTLGVFHYFQLTPGDTVGYGIVFVELANAVLSEVDVQFSTALQHRWSIFRDRHLQATLGPQYSRSLGSVPHLLRLFDGHAHPVTRRYTAAMRACGIKLDALIRLIPDLERLVEVRNPGAHAGGRIDREAAQMLFNRWFIQGVLRELFEAMNPST